MVVDGPGNLLENWSVFTDWRENTRLRPDQQHAFLCSDVEICQQSNSVLYSPRIGSRGIL
jgi:hypothetical protein